MFRKLIILLTTAKFESRKSKDEKFVFEHLLSFVALMTNGGEIRRVHNVVINIVIKLEDCFVVAVRKKSS